MLMNVALGKLNGDVSDAILFEPSKIDTESANGILSKEEGIVSNWLLLNQIETCLAAEVKLKIRSGRVVN